MSNLRYLIGKYRHLISYLFFGILTTAVNFAVYYPLYNWLHLSALTSNVIAWTVSVVFAYLTNKPFVFHSRDWHMKTVLPEFTKFVGCRVGSGAIESLLIFIFVEILLLNGNTFKLFVSVLVVILNYIGSKLVVFRK